jgi:hypothetical protein
MRHALSQSQQPMEFADGIILDAGRCEWPHNFAVMARGLLNRDLMFRTTCEFNDLRVAKIARLATLARSICRPVFSGMVRINFSRLNKDVSSKETNLIRPGGQDVLSFALSAELMIIRPAHRSLVVVLDLDLHESIAQSTIIETLLSQSFRPNSRSQSQTKCCGSA